jgi:integrase
VSLPGIVVEALRRQHLNQLRQQMAAKVWATTGRVFTTPSGTRIDARNVNRMWALVLEQAGVEHHTVHDLRHTWATFLLMAGEELRVVQEILDHTRLSTTADIYAHVLAEVRRRSADRMDGVLSDLGAAPGSSLSV